MRTLWALPLLLLAAIPALADTTDESIDQGSFVVYLHDQAIGAETFGVVGHADSINSGARVYRKARTPDGEKMIEKQMSLTASRSDFSLRFYQSNEIIDGKTLIT